MNLGKYGYKITEKEFKSAENICKRLARKYYEKNDRYTYEEYLSECYYGLSKAIKYFDRSKASFPTLAYISAKNSMNTLLSTDKKYNYKRGEGIEKSRLPVSINSPIAEEVNKNNEINTYEDILPSNKLNDDTYDIVKDYITRVFTDFYNSFNSRAERFKANKDRDINVILNICKGYTPMEVSKIIGISNQLVNSIIKKFRNYAIENNLVYSIN